MPDIQRQSDVSLSLFDKTGTFVSDETTRVHRHREKKEADKQLEGELSSGVTTCPSLLAFAMKTGQ